jgi:hypothetical protein
MLKSIRGYNDGKNVLAVYQQERETKKPYRQTGRKKKQRVRRKNKPKNGN